MPAQSTPSYLKQGHFLFGTREFMIKGEQSLLVRERSLLSQHETLLPLKLLHPNPTYTSTFSMKWLLNSLFMGTVSGFLIYWGHYKSMLLLYLLGAVFGITAVVLLYRFFLYTTRLVIFRHIQTQENFLYFWRDKPRKSEFEAFIHELTHLIHAQNTINHSHTSSDAANQPIPIRSNRH